VDSEHVAFLIVGVVVVFLVGQLLISAGRRYLARSTHQDEGGPAAPAATLLAVLFHLLTLGILAVITVLPIGGSSTTKFLIQSAILLIALAIIYGIALSLLGNRRDEALVAELETRAHLPNESARLTVRPRVDYDNGEYGHSQFGNGVPNDVPMDPASGTAMGQPRNEDAL
jgi:hypothetical protein